MKVRLVLAYDGSRFSGWQRQKNAPSVQAVLEEALHQILRKKVHVVGAGRTDAGVHAQGQVVHAVIPGAFPLPKLQHALNAVLPEDVVVRSIREVPEKFHARYSAASKWYRYQIWKDPVRPVFERKFVLHIPASLNLAAMRRCARQLKGKRDFRAFHASGRPVKSTIRNLRRLTITRKGPLLLIDAEADGFLYHMVRRIVGLLLEVGKGKVSPAQYQRIIPPTAPAKGLCLMKVTYPK